MSTKGYLQFQPNCFMFFSFNSSSRSGNDPDKKICSAILNKCCTGLFPSRIPRLKCHPALQNILKDVLVHHAADQDPLGYASFLPIRIRIRLIILYITKYSIDSGKHYMAFLTLTITLRSTKGRIRTWIRIKVKWDPNFV